MKIKKLFILVSMFALMFSLSGCDEAHDKPFEYNDTEIVIDTMAYFVSYMDIDKEYADYYLEDGTPFEQSAVKGIKQAQDMDNVGAFEDYSDCVEAIQIGQFNPESVDYSIENGEDYVTVTIINNAQNRDVEISIKYVENPQYYIEYNKALTAVLTEFETYYGMSKEDILDEAEMTNIEDAIFALAGYSIEDALFSNGYMPYIPEEMVVSAVYSKSELMKQAGMNTALGMGTVFVVLIFISFIISLFKFLPALFAKKPKVEVEKKAAPAPVKSAPVEKAPAKKAENLMNDAELVAVITAAIYAANGQQFGSGAVSKDKLVVRSIKRVRK